MERVLGTRRGNFKENGLIYEEYFLYLRRRGKNFEGGELCREESFEPMVKGESIEELGRERNEGSLEK